MLRITIAALLASTSLVVAQPVDITAWPFQAKCDGEIDDTAAIQSAIDWAFANNRQKVYVPTTGTGCKYTPPLWLDPPGNMRLSGVDNPTQFGFSMALVGDGFSGNSAQSSALRATTNTGVGLWIGPGQGMTVDGIYIFGPTGAPAPAALPSGGVGIAISGGAGGAHGVRIENSHVSNFYTAYKSGENIDALSDSITIRNSWADACYYGYWVGKTQNFIQRLDETVFACDTPVYNPQNLTVLVTGGNHSGPGANLAVFGISGISGLTPISGPSSGSFTFTGTITNPDALISLNVYRRSALKTAHMGVVPALMTNYAAPVATFRILDSWVDAHFGATNIPVTTDIVAELQAATQVFMAEDQTTWIGSVYAQNVHVETARPYTIIDAQAAQPTGNQQPITLDHIRLNGDPSASDLASCLGTGTTCEAAYLIQQSHPFMALSNTHTEIRDTYFGALNKTTDNIIIDGIPSGAIYDFQRHNLWSPNFRFWNWYNDNGCICGQTYNRYNGMGQFDKSPWNSGQFGVGSDFYSPTIGYRSAPWLTPRMMPAMWATINGMLSPSQLSGPNGPAYAPINGGTVYQVIDYTAAVPPKLVRSAHHFYSWGQSLPISWSYDGASNAVYLSRFSNIIDGLYMGLNLGAQTAWFVVTGIYPNLGYVTVTGLGDGTNVPTNPGTPGTIYTGAALLQEPYSFTTTTLQ